METGPSLSAVWAESDEVLYYVHGPGVTSRFRKPASSYHQVTSNGTYAVYVAEGGVHVASASGALMLLRVDTSRIYMKAAFLDQESPVRFADQL